MDIICMKLETAIIIGCALAIALMLFFLILPAVDSVTALRLTITNEKNRLASAEDSINKINNLRDEFSSKTDEIEKAGAALPESQEVDKLLTQLETLAAANSLIMKSVGFAEPKKSISIPTTIEPSDEAVFSTKKDNSSQPTPLVPKAEVSAPAYNILEINLKLDGGYDAFKKYLEAAESNARLLNVISFNLGKQSEQEIQAANYNISVVMDAYYQ